MECDLIGGNVGHPLEGIGTASLGSHGWAATFG